jgi:hypothetical protein
LRVRRGYANRGKPRRILSAGRTAAHIFFTGVVAVMMMLVVVVVFAMVTPLVMSMVVTIVGMPMVMFMAVVVLMFVVIAHELRSLSVSGTAPRRGFC